MIWFSATMLSIAPVHGLVTTATWAEAALQLYHSEWSSPWPWQGCPSFSKMVPLSQVTSQSRWWIGLLTRMSFFWTGQVRIRTSTQQKTSGQHSRDCSTASSSLPRTWNNWPSTWRSPGRFLAGTEKCSSTFVTQWRGGSQVCWQLREVTPNTILTPFFETYINDYCYTYTSTYTKLINWSDLNPELISTIFFWIWFFSV